MAHFQENTIVSFHDDVDTHLRIGKLIGSGTQADVYKALDILPNRYVAAKHLYGRYATDKDRFYQKACLLAKYPSPHPNFCWPMAVSQLTDNKSFVYIMPLLEGYRPLTDAINRVDPLTDRQKAQLLLKIAEAFDTLHKKKFIYGDISDRNILYRINSDGSVSVKIIDCENVTLAGFSFGLQGSGKYRAPELLIPDPDRMDHKPKPPSKYSDTYAFQVLAFRVLLRRHPLDGKLARSVAADDHQGFLKYYGYNPRFIFDGTANNPGPRVSENWAKLPMPMQLYFRNCFSQTALHQKEKRPSLEDFKIILSMSYCV